MATILFVLLMIAVSFCVVLLVLYSSQHDLERDHLVLQDQHRQLQEQFRTREQQWLEQWQKVEARFKPVLSLDREAEAVRAEIKNLKLQFQAEVTQYQQEQANLNAQRAVVAQQQQLLSSNYLAAKMVYDKLLEEIGQLEGNIEDISFGLYRPQFDFASSETYKRELEAARSIRKEMIRDNAATRCQVEWTVGGSRADGVRMQKQLTKLMLRAFNGECDAAIANCRWNNITRMIERIRRAYAAINQLGTVVQVEILPQYYDVAIRELQLEFEYQEKRRAEAEEQKEIRDRMREEERARRELEREEAESASEENRYAAALARAHVELASAQGARLQSLAERIKLLETQLSEAHARHERAVSMAQLTRCGYVYLISNVGSFGENMYKIGLTRRVEPLERVRELGDASVPFAFDVHAMVYSQDAPALEYALHQHFRDRSVNLVNPRKEFFHVSLEEIGTFLMARGHQVEITQLAEAREYRETIALRQKQASQNGQRAPTAFPAELAMR
jgi:hypothetical protein